MTPFQAALISGKAIRRALKAETITYCTDSFEISIPACVGSTVFRIDTEQQFNQRVRSRDFLILKSDLVDPISGKTFEPAEGHRIRETINGETQVCEILPFGHEPGFRDSDTTGTEWRCHTKRVGREAA